MQKKEYTLNIGGKTLTAEFSDLTDQANGSVILRYGNTVVLATAVMAKKAKEGAGWFPLTVDYEEKFYARGQILGSRFMRREGRPTDEAILTARVIDRTIRPLFEQHIRHDIQVVITVLSIDKDDPDILAINAASLALAVSDIPWDGPVSAVRVAKKKTDNSFKINPEYEDRDNEDSEFEMIICGKDGNINMVEAYGKEVDENVAGKVFEKATLEVEKLQEFQKNIVKEIGKEKVVIEKPEISKEVKDLFKEKTENKLSEALFSGPGNDGLRTLGDKWKEIVKESLPEENTSLTDEYFEEKVNELMHKEAVTSEKRADGRKMNEVRSLYAQAGGVSPILHGSGIFL